MDLLLYLGVASGIISAALWSYMPRQGFDQDRCDGCALFNIVLAVAGFVVPGLKFQSLIIAAAYSVVLILQCILLIVFLLLSRRE